MRDLLKFAGDITSLARAGKCEADKLGATRAIQWLTVSHQVAETALEVDSVVEDALLLREFSKGRLP